MGTRPAWKYVGTCDITLKRQYSSRKNARAAARDVGDSNLHAFRCVHCDLWHIGHKDRRTNEQHRIAAERTRAR